MKWTSVQSRNKSLDYFAGNQSQVIKLVKLFYIENVFQNENGKFWLCRELPKISWQNNPMPVLSDNKCLWKFKKPAQHHFDSEKLDLVREWLDFDLENQTAQFRLKKEKVNLHKYFWNLESKEPNIIDLGEVNI